MKSLRNICDRNEILARLEKLRASDGPRWGAMSAHQMICHLGDSFRAALGEKHISPASTPFKRTVMKWWALWMPLPWPHGIKTRPEMDQQQGGTPPAEFAADVQTLRGLVERFCNSEGEFAPHATLGQLSRGERMRHAYLHMNHHLRQFGA
jgi:hypothetical protein